MIKIKNLQNTLLLLINFSAIKIISSFFKYEYIYKLNMILAIDSEAGNL
jgi:hypothetical protein